MFLKDDDYGYSVERLEGGQENVDANHDDFTEVEEDLPVEGLVV
jgi:hypothetical protein